MSNPVRLIRLPEVMHLVGLRKAEIYKRAAEGRFPSAIKLAPKATAWLYADVEAWINERVAESRAKHGGSL